MKRRILLPISDDNIQLNTRNNLEINSVKRHLGEGKWDKILKERMVELSVADDYEEAKHEWIATGEVFWSDYYVPQERMPEWITNSRNGYGKCLCGHRIKYHFRIENTENGNVECVGSDHINSYLIVRQISQELNIPADMITDEQIKEWIDVRIKSMKAEAWWAEQGQAFEMMFEAVRELDLYYNVHQKGGTYWDAELEENRDITTIRKRADGKFGQTGYKMASIVWRWNHPDNPKNQQTVHGFPNDNLMKDLALFYVKSTELSLEFLAEKKRIEERKANIARRREEIIERRRLREAKRQAELEERRRYIQSPEYQEKLRIERERQEKLQREREAQRIAAFKKEQEGYRSILREQSRTFRFGCAQFNMPMFDETWATHSTDLRTLTRIKTKMEERKSLSDYDITFLHGKYKEVMPTEKQLKYLKDLGYDEKVKTKFEASELISKLKAKNQQGEGHPE
jgi:hypothetical protein